MLCTEIIYIKLQTSVRLFQISSQKKSFLTTPNVENKFWSSYETLKSPGEMKLMIKFYLCLHNFLNFESLFSRVPMGNCFWCYFRQLFISLAFRKYIENFHILIIILVQDICPLKTEIALFPIGFCLKVFVASIKTNYIPFPFIPYKIEKIKFSLFCISFVGRLQYLMKFALRLTVFIIVNLAVVSWLTICGNEWINEWINEWKISQTSQVSPTELQLASEHSWMPLIFPRTDCTLRVGLDLHLPVLRWKKGRRQFFQKTRSKGHSYIQLHKS